MKKHTENYERSVRREMNYTQILVYALRIIAFEGPLTLYAISRRVSEALNLNFERIRAYFLRRLNILEEAMIIEVLERPRKGKGKYVIDIGPVGLDILLAYDEREIGELAAVEVLKRKGYLTEDLAEFIKELCFHEKTKHIKERIYKPPSKELILIRGPWILEELIEVKPILYKNTLRKFDSHYMRLIVNEFGFGTLLSKCLSFNVPAAFSLLSEPPYSETEKELFEKAKKKNLMRIINAFKKLKPMSKETILVGLERTIRYLSAELESNKELYHKLRSNI